METSLPLASDSFSYSWLSNCKSSVDDALEEPLRESFHISYGDSTSKEFDSTIEYQNFNFDISIAQSPIVLVHADELFSDGLIRPLFVDPSKVESCNSTPDLSSSFSSRNFSPRTEEVHHGFLTRWRKSTRQTLVELFRHLNMLRRKVRCSSKSTRVDDIDKSDWQVKSLSSSQQASPKPIIGDLHDHENSIYEAVLHCKRSIGK